MKDQIKGFITYFRNKLRAIYRTQIPFQGEHKNAPSIRNNAGEIISPGEGIKYKKND